MPRFISTTCSVTVGIAAIAAEIADVALRLVTKRKKQVAPAQAIALRCSVRANLQLKHRGRQRNNCKRSTVPLRTILRISRPDGMAEEFTLFAKSTSISGSLLGVLIPSMEQLMTLELSWKQMPDSVSDRHWRSFTKERSTDNKTCARWNLTEVSDSTALAGCTRCKREFVVHATISQFHKEQVVLHGRRRSTPKGHKNSRLDRAMGRMLGFILVRMNPVAATRSVRIRGSPQAPGRQASLINLQHIWI